MLDIAKRDLLDSISSGYYVNLQNVHHDDSEHFDYINQTMMVNHESLYWFSESKFSRHIHGLTAEDETQFHTVMNYFEENDVSLRDAFDDACIDLQDFRAFVPPERWSSRHDRLYEAIRNGTIMTYDDLLSFSTMPPGHLWAMIKASTRLLTLHKKAAESANHPDRMVQRGEFTNMFLIDELTE